MRVLAVSPHLDDAAFSVGGILAGLAAAGADVTVITCFTASVPDPEGFALACQLDKGVSADADYMALRRAEDEVALRRLGVRQTLRLPQPEAPHRGYADAPALFAGVRADDDVWRTLLGPLSAPAAAADVVLAPLGCGSHVDHLQVVRAVTELRLGSRVAWWRDTPYVLRDPQATGGVTGLHEEAVPVGPVALAAKLAGCAAYATQLGFQFGGEPQMRAALTDLAAAEGRRLGAPAPAVEVLAGPAASQLAALLGQEVPRSPLPQ